MRRAGSAFAYAPRAAVVSGQALAASAQQIIAASASGVGPAGRGALRLMEVAALVLAAALKAGNERLSLTMAADNSSTATASTPAPRRPIAHPARFSLVALLGLPRPARSSLAGPDGAGGGRSRAASFTPLFRAHAAGA
eukprot:tig00021146_g19051.t2